MTEMQRRIRWFEIGYFVFVVAIHAAIAAGRREGVAWWFRSDDAFFYFRTARHIVEGLGSTFDGVSLTNGYHPLWMLVSLPAFALGRGDPWLPLRLLIVVAGALTAASGVLLIRMFSRAGVPVVGALIALFWALWPPIHATTTQLGLESALDAFLFVLVLSQLSRLPGDRPPSPRQVWGIALSLALLVLCRLDNIFAVFLFGLWVVLANNPLRTRAVLYILAVSFSLVAGLLWRVGPEGLPGFKAGASIMLALTWALHVPALLWITNYRTSRFLVRAGSVVAGSLAATALTFGAALLLRLVGLETFPLSAPVYGGVVLALLLLGLEGYLWWLAPRSPGVSARTAFADERRLWIRRGLIVFGVLGVTLAAYMGWSQAVFGTPMPVSGQVKEWWGTIYSAYGRPPDTVAGVLGLDLEDPAAPIEPIARAVTFYAEPTPTGLGLPLLIGIAVIVLWMLRGAWLREEVVRFGLIPLGCGMAILAWFYGIRGSVNLREWYWIGVLVFGVCWLGLFLGVLWRWAAPRSKPAVLHGAFAVLGLILVFNFAGYTVRRFVHPDPTPLATLEESLRFVSGSTEPGSLIGVTGGGTLGYFLEGRSIVNLDGLANSNEYFRSSRREQGASFLTSIGLDYVFASRGMLPATEPYLHTFDGNLETIATEGTMALFRFQPSAP